MVTSMLCFCNLFDTNISSCNITNLGVLYLLSSLPCSLARVAPEAARTGFCRKEGDEIIFEIGNIEEEAP